MHNSKTRYTNKIHMFMFLVCVYVYGNETGQATRERKFIAHLCLYKKLKLHREYYGT